MEKIFYTINEITEVSQQLLTKCRTQTLCFYGPMGAGKTTLIQSLVKLLDGKDMANSPTFGIVNEYHKQNGHLLGYHFDFYRLKDEFEALDIGVEDYFASESWLFLEWPDKIENLLPRQHTKITISIEGASSRTLEIEEVK